MAYMDYDEVEREVLRFAGDMDLLYVEPHHTTTIEKLARASWHRGVTVTIRVLSKGVFNRAELDQRFQRLIITSAIHGELSHLYDYDDGLPTLEEAQWRSTHFDRPGRTDGMNLFPRGSVSSLLARGEPGSLFWVGSRVEDGSTAMGVRR